MDNGQIILFQTQGGETKIEVRLANKSVWLTADQMAQLFQCARSTIHRRIKRIYDEGEQTADRRVGGVGRGVGGFLGTGVREEREGRGGAPWRGLH